MKGNEKQVLKIVSELQETNSRSIARKVGASAEFITEVCDGLVDDGYLAKTHNGKFMITPFAQKAISPVRTSGMIPVLKGGG